MYSTTCRATLLATIFLLLGTAVMGNYCEKAYDKCKFRFGFSTKLQTFKLKEKSDIVFTRRIRSKRFGRLVGVINTGNMSSEFLFAKNGFSLTEFGKPSYSPSHFKPILIRGSRGSGIAHEKFRGDQFQYARYRCVRVHFASYQLLDINGFKRNFNNVRNDNTHCVVFKTK